ncbi:MAG: alpha/beta fold hydrolase [Alphaproteobacteria bacterium]|nr:alpha/beta fold hydrolase [Alphaproteobacteria bacterium]
MAGWLATGAVVYGGLVTALYLFQRQLLYHPATATPDLAASHVPDMRAVRLATDDGLDLLAWYKAPPPGRALVIMFHGNAGHIGHRGWKARRYLDAGYGVMLVSWRGFGGNRGSPSEEGLMRDGRAALAFAIGEGVKPARLVFYGESLGSGIAVALAAEQGAAGDPVGAVVLEAPYSSIAEVAQHHYFYIPARHLIRDKFDSMARIAGIKAPLLVVHGELDRTIPVHFARALYDRAVEPKEAVWLPAAGHNDVYDHGAGEAVLAFLARVNGFPRSP